MLAIRLNVLYLSMHVCVFVFVVNIFICNSLLCFDELNLHFRANHRGRRRKCHTQYILLFLSLSRRQHYQFHSPIKLRTFRKPSHGHLSQEDDSSSSIAADNLSCITNYNTTSELSLTVVLFLLEC